MAKKKVSQKKSSKKSKTKVAKKPKQTKPFSKKEQKLLVLGKFLDEIFHIAGHSIDSGNESDTPLEEILAAALFVHNELEDAQTHKISEIHLICNCSEKQHTLKARKFEDTCGH